MNKKSIYISYSWSAEKKYRLIEKISPIFEEHGFNVSDDRKLLIEKGRIYDCMYQYKDNSIIIVINHEYLSSEYCMYELIEIFRTKKFINKIFPIIVDVNLFSKDTNLFYKKYWLDILKNYELHSESNIDERINNLTYKEINNTKKILNLIDEIFFLISEFQTINISNNITLEEAEVLASKIIGAIK